MKINFGKYTYVDNKKLLNSPIAPQYRVNEINSINANENPSWILDIPWINPTLFF